MIYSVLEVREDSVLAEFRSGSLIRIGTDIIDGQVRVNDILESSGGRFAVDREKTERAKRDNFILAQSLKE